jgi:hypothetical protein
MAARVLANAVAKDPSLKVRIIDKRSTKYGGAVFKIELELCSI